MSNTYKLVYGHDPICGWCYGFIPALEAFAKARPDVEIELVVGGLFTGDSVRSYAEMDGYIRRAFKRVQSMTGRLPSVAFFDMIVDKQTGLIQSATPSHALLQMKRLVPEKSVAYAHELQKAHFEQGLSYNDADTYKYVSEKLLLPVPDVTAALDATDASDLVRQGYDRARALGIQSYPTCIVVDENDQPVGTIDSEYDPLAFIGAFDEISTGSLTSRKAAS